MTQTRSLSELPAEILTKIFLRSPPKSLVSCKHACKSFHEIIRNPNFTLTHLTRFHSHDSTYIMLKLMYKSLHPYRDSHHLLLSIDNATNDIISCSFISNPPIPNLGEYDRVYVVGSCNGLICFSVWYDRGKEYDLLFLLWNVASGETRFLSKPKYSTMTQVIEFGFVPETNDYVVVKLDGHKTRVRGEVYKMSTDSWTDIDCSMVMEYVRVERGEGSVFLNGCFHWKAVGYGSSWIISYKLLSEEVGLIKGHDDVVELKNCKLTLVEQSLAMLYYNSDVVPHKFELWVLDDYNVHDSWALRFQIVDDGNNFLRPVGCLGNGLMITYEKDYFGVYIHDLSTGKKTKISAVPYGWTVTGFSKFSGSTVVVPLS